MTNNQLTASHLLVQRMKVAAKNGCCHTLLPDDCRALVEAFEADTAELQEHRKAASQPLLYVMQGDGIDFGEYASTRKAVIDDWVDEWNESKEPDVQMYITVPLYAAPQPLNDAERAELQEHRKERVQHQHLGELYHAQEKRLFKIAQRIKGPAFDKYAHSPSQAIDVLESAIFGESAAELGALQEHRKAADPIYQYRIRNGYNGQVTEWQTIRRDQVDFVLKAQPHNAEFQIIAAPQNVNLPTE